MLCTTIDEAGAQAVEAPAASIEGVVYDSLITGGPLKGATVYVIGTNLAATTDAKGRFAIGAVAAGDYSLTFAHPTFDSAGVQAPQVATRVVASSKVRVTLATPQGATLIKASCRGPKAERTGLLLGVVRDAEAGTPLPGARVVSRWFELSIDKNGVARYETPEIAAIADANGVFRLCGAPSDIPVLVRARFNSQESGRIEVYFPGSAVAFRDFAISTTDTAARQLPDSLTEVSIDSTAFVSSRGAGIVRGAVRDANGRPVPNARVGLLDRAAVVLTNADGGFTLPDLPSGTQTLEVRAIGFAPLRQTIVMRAGQPAEVRPTLARAAQSLSPVSILGARVSGRLTKAGFNDRRKFGLGFFMNADEIEKKSGIYLGDVLRFAPGVAMAYTQKGRIFTMRSNWGGERCLPTYFLDGSRWFALEGSPILELERYIQLHDLEAVEVYAGGASTPAQFDGGNGCGSVVFWTKQ
jgi:hypothetical protein